MHTGIRHLMALPGKQQHKHYTLVPAPLGVEPDTVSMIAPTTVYVFDFGKDIYVYATVCLLSHS